MQICKYQLLSDSSDLTCSCSALQLCPSILYHNMILSFLFSRSNVLPLWLPHESSLAAMDLCISQWVWSRFRGDYEVANSMYMQYHKIPALHFMKRLLESLWQDPLSASDTWANHWSPDLCPISCYCYTICCIKCMKLFMHWLHYSA